MKHIKLFQTVSLERSTWTLIEQVMEEQNKDLSGAIGLLVRRGYVALEQEKSAQTAILSP